MSLKVRDLIEALKTFPQDAEVYLCNEYGDFEYQHLFGLTYDSESDDFGGLSYSCVAICAINIGHYNYGDLKFEELELCGDKVWYNTKDGVQTHNCEGKSVTLYYDPETKHFKEQII